MKEEKTLSVALLQSSLIWEDPVKNRDFFSKKLKLISKPIDLIVLPEMFTTGFTMHPEKFSLEEAQKTVAWMQKWATEKNAALTGSIVFREKEAFMNRLFFIHPNGKEEYYDKRHTFTLAGESDVYRAGTEKIIIDYKDFKICPMICYDLRFPVWARNTENYDVLLYVANWPKPRITAWDTLLKARAIENMAYCLGVNRIGVDEAGHEYPGHSAVYDGLGELLSFSQKEELLFATLEKNHLTTIRRKLRFLEDSDTFTLEV